MKKLFFLIINYYNKIKQYFSMQMAMAAILLCCVIVSSPSIAAITKNANINNQLLTTRKNMVHLHTNIALNKNKINKMIQELHVAEEKVSKIAKELYVLSTSLQNDKKLYNKLQAEFTTIATKYKTNQNILAKQIQIAYQLQNIPQIKLLLGEYNPSNITRVLVYYEYLYNYKQQKLKTSLATLKATQILQQKMQTKISAIQAKQLEKNQQMQALKRANIARASLLTVLNSTVSQDSKTLSLLQRDEKSLEQKIVQLQRSSLPSITISNREVFNNLLPHSPIVSKTIKVKMQEISSINPHRFLLHASPGSKIHAIHDGRVVFADWLRGYGLLLIIAHNNDLMSLYGHNQTIFKKVGDIVTRGEVIGLVGQSGGQAKPGLYFEVRKSAKSINLRNWFDYETT